MFSETDVNCYHWEPDFFYFRICSDSNIDTRIIVQWTHDYFNTNIQTCYKYETPRPLVGVWKNLNMWGVRLVDRIILPLSHSTSSNFVGYILPYTDGDQNIIKKNVYFS